MTLTAAPDRRAVVDALKRRWPTGELKLHVTHTALRVRAALPDVFLRGDYDTLIAGDHVVAFCRSHGTSRVVVLAPRLTWRLTGGDGRWPVGGLELRPREHPDGNVSRGPHRP